MDYRITKINQHINLYAIISKGNNIILRSTDKPFIEKTAFLLNNYEKIKKIAMIGLTEINKKVCKNCEERKTDYCVDCRFNEIIEYKNEIEQKLKEIT